MVPFMKAVEGLRDYFKDTFGLRLNPWSIFGLGVTLLLIAFVFMPNVVTLALSIALFLAPLWLPFLLVGGALPVSPVLKRFEFIANQKYILLDIKPPRNLVKTPLAMEAFMPALHQHGGESP